MVVQWLGLLAFTAEGTGSIPGRELRSRKLHGTAKKKKSDPGRCTAYNKRNDRHYQFPLAETSGISTAMALRVSDQHGRNVMFSDTDAIAHPRLRVLTQSWTWL